MSKAISRDTQSGRFVVGQTSGKKFSAVEGIHETPRTTQLARESAAAKDSGDAKRQRIIRAFKK